MTTPTHVQSPASPMKPEKSLRAHWLHGAGVGVLLQGVGLVLAFSSSVLVARLLGPHGLGQYSYVLAIVAVLSVIATFGMPTVITKLLAIYQTKGEWGQARGLLRWSNILVGASGALLGLGMIVVGIVWDGGGQRWLYILAAPLVVVLAWVSLRQCALQGLRRPLASQLPEQFVKHTVFLAVAGTLWLAGNQFVMRSDGVMTVWLLAGLVSLLFGAVLLRRFSPPVLREAESQYEPRAWVAIAIPIYIANMLGVVFMNADTLILGWLRSSEEVGLYQIALRLSGLMAVLMSSSAWVLAPWFVRFQETNEKERLQRVVTRTTRAIFAVTVMLYLVILLWGEALIELFFGERFIESYPVLLILGVGQMINVASGPVVELLVMTGGQRKLAWSVAAAAVLNIVLCILLIPVFGQIGAAISVAISLSMYNILLAVLVKRSIGIAATIFG